MTGFGWIVGVAVTVAVAERGLAPLFVPLPAKAEEKRRNAGLGVGIVVGLCLDSRAEAVLGLLTGAGTGALFAADSAEFGRLGPFGMVEVDVVSKAVLKFCGGLGKSQGGFRVSECMRGHTSGCEHA